MAKKIDLEGLVIPEHVAIILDGNGRWAKKRHLPRTAGHVAGAKTVEKIIEDAHEMGIKYITMYAFSTENWNRPEDEVKALMKLLRNYLKDCIERANKNKMKVKVLGDKSRLDQDIIDRINELEECSKENTGIQFNIALNYGSRDEIRRAVQKIGNSVKEGTLKPEDISEDIISSYLDTAGIPDPDLLIRTSGEIRLSNYLLWQLAYTEFYFTDVLWPDFNAEELKKAIVYFNGRDRRYGGVK
ncbi:MAG: isoprenyl transferase [Eubacterium sp.]|nr:isoprenyl transferase [Eubacterium sp.]